MGVCQVDFRKTGRSFLQIAEMLEDAILTGAFPEGEQVPSTTEISVRYQINPATALKGVNQLVEAGILHKRRGVGMFVSTGAIQQLRKKRREQFYRAHALPLAQEAVRLGISRGGNQFNDRKRVYRMQAIEVKSVQKTIP